MQKFLFVAIIFGSLYFTEAWAKEINKEDPNLASTAAPVGTYRIDDSVVKPNTKPNSASLKKKRRTPPQSTSDSDK